MIQHPIPTWQVLDWQDELKGLITQPAELIELLELDQSLLPQAEAAAKLFPLRVTPSFLSRIKRGDLNDPLLKQVLPLGAELETKPEFSADPLEEAQFNPIKGLIHKYTNRVLVIAATNCAINCRYCFRREFDYRANRLSRDDWSAIFNYIAARPEIDELIFSGGEPLLLSDAHLAWVLEELEKISHLERIRLHSRLPIVLPSRLTLELIRTLTETRFQSVLVVHCNHANELNDETGLALSEARKHGITVLNQAVALKGINDTAEDQINLAKRLFHYGVLPYYLHMLDRVVGSTHFELTLTEVLELYERMRETLPGYLLPKLVKEEAGERAKTVISPN